jgi:hypothetical protein
LLRFAIVEDFSSALSSDSFFLGLNDEMLSLFGGFLFPHSSDDSTELMNAETTSESTASAILKRLFFTTSMMASNVG